jgi:hypothetical protein
MIWELEALRVKIEPIHTRFSPLTLTTQSLSCNSFWGRDELIMNECSWHSLVTRQDKTLIIFGKVFYGVGWRFAYPTILAHSRLEEVTYYLT